MYDFSTHQHNFAAWAAARAAQRRWKGASTAFLKTAIESSSMRSFLGNEKSYEISEVGFESIHRKWCAEVKASLLEQGLARDPISHGRLAKLVAVYLKSVVVLGPQCNTRLADVIHPPIDGLLLKGLWQREKLDFVRDADRKLIAWTQLDEDGYYELIKRLRNWFNSSKPFKPFWALEEYWPVA